MPITRINGLNDLTFQGNSFSFNPRNGFSMRYPYTGPTIAAAARVSGLIASRTPFNYEQRGPQATITIDGNSDIEASSPAEQPIDNWNLRGNETRNSIKNHPNSLLIEAAAPGALKQISYDVENQNMTGVASPRNAPNGTVITVTLPTAGGLGTLVTNLKKLLAQDQDSYAIYRPILRHVQSVNDRYAGTAFNFNDCEKIFTTTQLLAECATFPYPLPPPFIFAVLSIPATSATGFTWGWRKIPPDGNTVARYKNEFVTEYAADLWSTSFVYSLKI